MAQTHIVPLDGVIKEYEVRHSNLFKPSKPFYEKVGINRIRFSKLRKGDKLPTSLEVKSLANFFGVPVDRLIG